MTLRLAFAFASLVMTALSSAAVPPAPAPTAPVAQKIPKDVTVHGDTRIDDYFWLREQDNPAVL